MGLMSIKRVKELKLQLLLLLFLIFTTTSCSNNSRGLYKNNLPNPQEKSDLNNPKTPTGPTLAIPTPKSNVNSDSPSDQMNDQDDTSTSTSTSTSNNNNANNETTNNTADVDSNTPNDNGGENSGGGNPINNDDEENSEGTTNDNNNSNACIQQTSDNFTLTIEHPNKVDIIWAIDNSATMGEKQQALALYFEDFIRDFIIKKSDFKMVIITTDASQGHDGKIVNNSDFFLDSYHAQKDERKFMQDFARLSNVGTKGSDDVQGLHTTEAFLTNYAKDFLRPDAYLIIITISDKDDVSLKSVKNYIHFYKSQKANPGHVKFYSIVTKTPVNIGESVGDRYLAASELTGGLTADINTNFSYILSDMSEKIFELFDSFALSKRPLSTPEKVMINGTTIISG